MPLPWKSQTTLHRHFNVLTCLLIVSVGRGDGLRDSLLLEDESKPVKVRLVAVGGRERVRGEGWAAAGGPEGAGGGERETERELGVYRKTKVSKLGSDANVAGPVAYPGWPQRRPRRGSGCSGRR